MRDEEGGGRGAEEGGGERVEWGKEPGERGDGAGGGRGARERSGSQGRRAGPWKPRAPGRGCQLGLRPGPKSATLRLPPSLPPSLRQGDPQLTHGALAGAGGSERAGPGAGPPGQVARRRPGRVPGGAGRRQPLASLSLSLLSLSLSLSLPPSLALSLSPGGDLAERVVGEAQSPPPPSLGSGDLAERVD
jgi:hypothetical protein